MPSQLPTMSSLSNCVAHSVIVVRRSPSDENKKKQHRNSPSFMLLVAVFFLSNFMSFRCINWFGNVELCLHQSLFQQMALLHRRRIPETEWMLLAFACMCAPGRVVHQDFSTDSLTILSSFVHTDSMTSESIWQKSGIVFWNTDDISFNA